MKSIRWQDHIASATALQFALGCFEYHQPEAPFVLKRFCSFGEVNRLPIEVPAKVESSDPFAGLLDSVFPAQLLTDVAPPRMVGRYS